MSYVCDIIVLTWNQIETSKQFFDSLGNIDVPIRVIVVDNASTDGTREYLRGLTNTSKCDFKVIYNEENFGFIKGVNQGLAFSDAPYVCLANNDLIFTKGWLEEVIHLFEKYNQIGVLNPNSNTLGVHKNEAQTLDNLAGKLRKEYHGVFLEMPFCSGFCMVIKREVLDKVGGLSEDYVPMFFEDTDFSMKALSAGYLIGVAKGAYVWHKEHASFKVKSPAYRQIFKKSQDIFTKKWGRILRIAWIEPDHSRLNSDLTRGVELARQGNFITFYVPKIKHGEEAGFKSKNIFEHSGVQFKKFGGFVGLIWGILIKKKKFNLIISRNRHLCFILNKLGQRTVSFLEDDLLARCKTNH